MMSLALQAQGGKLLGLVRGGFAAGALDDRQAQHGAQAPNLADDRELLLPFFEALLELFAQCPGLASSCSSSKISNTARAAAQASGLPL